MVSYHNHNCNMWYSTASTVGTCSKSLFICLYILHEFYYIVYTMCPSRFDDREAVLLWFCLLVTDVARHGLMSSDEDQSHSHVVSCCETQQCI